MDVRFAPIPSFAFKETVSSLMIMDWRFYVRYETDITNWMGQHLSGWQRQGMVLHFSNDNERTAFLLRWQDA